ncbi:hypothetical protein [Bacillus sp. FJAT-27251]|uniref:hypothetical protein n=1 Tax=Bacillus sp. FJAT-27251 TaxID=1684142 RepID=UPI00336A32E6
MGGSVVAYALGITQVSPLEEKLLYDRFCTIYTFSISNLTYIVIYCSGICNVNKFGQTINN